MGVRDLDYLMVRGRFERHSRLGMVDEELFLKEVDRLRSLGAKYVTLKTGAYRPEEAYLLVGGRGQAACKIRESYIRYYVGIEK